MTVNRIYLGCGLNRTFEDIFHYFIDPTTNRLVKKTINNEHNSFLQLELCVYMEKHKADLKSRARFTITNPT